MFFDLAGHSSVKIGVLSDTHTYITPKVLDHISGCDLILHAGDIGSIEVIKQLREISSSVISVRGNNDTPQQWCASEHEDLNAIPQIAEVGLPGGNIVLTHGDEYFAAEENWHNDLRQNFSNAKAIIYGHSHKLVCDQSIDPWVLNPGPAGDTRTHRHGVSCLRIDANKEEWGVSEFRV